MPKSSIADGQRAYKSRLIQIQVKAPYLVEKIFLVITSQFFEGTKTLTTVNQNLILAALLIEILFLLILSTIQFQECFSYQN